MTLMYPVNSRRPWLRPLAAKLVIVASAAVALATSAPPSWDAIESRELVVTLADGNPSELLVTVELGGLLYTDAAAGQLRLTAIADRAATDLTLSVRRLAPSPPPESASEEPAPDFFQGEGDGGVAPEGGAPDAGRVDGVLLEASPSLEAPDRASVSAPLLCVELEGLEGPETCREVFLLHLSRASRQALNVAVHAELSLIGASPDQPRGTLQLAIEQVTP